MANYEKRANGTWSVRFRTVIGTEEVNKRLSGFKTKRDAEAAYAEFLLRKPKDPIREMTFKALSLAYFDAQKSRVKESTYNDEFARVKKNVLPFFGDMLVVDITPLIILEWQRTLECFSYQYKSAIRSVVVAIFRFGNRYYNLPVPTDKADSFRDLEPKKEMQIYTLAQFRAFISCITDQIEHAFFSTLFYGGLRKGEAYALQWQDYDFETHKLKITKSISKKFHGRSWTVTTPKNKNSVRTITVPDALDAEFRTLESGKPTAFIFGGVRPLSDTNVTRHFGEAAKKANLPRIRLHDLRHSCASLLLSTENGASVSPVAVAKYLGHTVAMLLATYAHALTADEDAIKNKFL